MIPPSIPTDCCPGGYVAVLADAEGVIVEQASVEPDDQLDVMTAINHGRHVRDEGGVVAVYDGDSGRLIVILSQSSLIAPGFERFN